MGANIQLGATAELQLSVVIPAYNERDTIANVLRQVASALPNVAKQIVIVDDGSTDGTRQWLEQQFGTADFIVGAIKLDAQGKPQFLRQTDRTTGPDSEPPITIRVILHERNGGKGQAVRTGIVQSTGDIVVIQDADLEYDPTDWATMFGLFQKGVADVVYGSRFYGKPHRVLYFYHLLGNKIITYLFNLLFNQTFSDLETGCKMFRRHLVASHALRSTDFGIEVELSALFATTTKCRIYETGVSYYGRTYEDGKKINWRDGLKALWYVIKFRLVPPKLTSPL